MEDKIFEIIVGAFKRKLIVSDMVEMNKIAGGIDEATKAHYMPIIEKQEELIEVFKSFVPDLQNDDCNQLKSKIAALKDKLKNK